MGYVETDWIKAVFDGAKKVSKYYRWPHATNRLKEVAKEKIRSTDIQSLGEYDKIQDTFKAFYRLKKYKKLAETRWSQYCTGVLQAILSNYPAMLIDLKRQAEDNDRNALKLRAVTSNAEFILW